MTKKEIFDILKKATNFELKEFSSGPFGWGSILDSPEYNDRDYESHYNKMKNLLESLPWEKIVKNPRNPKMDEYPQEDGTYITMMDCNEHEVCTNEFKDGKFTWMNRTHIKWWMKLPE